MPFEVVATDVPSGTARCRIIDAGIRCVVRGGSGGASMAAIAAEGGVSKALLHYHFADRAHLLAEVVTHLGRRVVTREHIAIESNMAEGPVDAFWRWLHAELACGELRALIALSTMRDTMVRDALASASARRRAEAMKTVTRIFERLAIVPRIPVEWIANASVAFMDGLVLDHAYGNRDARVSFDVFWLALLSLGE